MMKRALSALLALSLLLSAALAEPALPEPESAPRNMLLGETAAEYFYDATLYYVGADGVTLTQASRTLLIRRGETLAETVLTALLNPSGNAGQASIAPGDTRLLSCELAGGIATVNLSIEARNVQSDQELLMMYAAIAGTLSEIGGVGGVSILINGRQEGLLELPVGVLTGASENIAAAWAQLTAEADRYFGSSGGSITRTAVAYYPSADGARLVPEAREISFTERKCAEELLSELASRPRSLRAALPTFPEGAEPLGGDPVLTVTSAGERILELNLLGEAVRAAEGSGVLPWQIYGSVALSLCSFLPELDAVRISVDGEPVTQLEHPTMQFTFDGGLMRRRSFSGYVGGVADLCFADADGNLVVRQCAMSPGAALSPRALLEALFSAEVARRLNAAKPVPEALGATDILGVRVEQGVATVNLSARFYSLCQDLDERRERTAVYAIVNTLCTLQGIRGVRFLIEGSAIGTLTEHIYLRSVLLPSPGLAEG
ncbi:MAG: Sporulation and spore germination [Firmicutes bacterium ADurb.Bin467]|nr:MAG: Sporulation and spore germination [Firmicutes bacterium ADurb.Bin467]